jgi:hypothetical protein
MLLLERLELEVRASATFGAPLQNVFAPVVLVVLMRLLSWATQFRDSPCDNSRL